MAYDFHYTPTGTGVISGKEVLEQTEDAINDLGNTAISGVQEALDKAEQALTNSANAVDDAQTALNTANNAEGVAIQAQTDVSNLSGTVTNIGNRVTTAEGNISNLQGRMTTAEGNITNLQGRMTTAETNIGNLQTAVSTAQATANSAQQTATTARQQSYVFRYSSTALVASSTNSNTLLDNTDNLKVGDKVIDSNGVLFSITAIDSVNSTFTVGSALIDLAQDSDVVHKSGDETVSGYKVFENICLSNSIKAINLENQTIDLNNCYSSFGIPQSGNISFYFCNTNDGTANISNLPEQKAFFLISQSIRILSGGSVVYAKQTLVNSNGKTFVRYCNNSVWDSWQNVTNLVTTDTNQTVSGNKTFSSNVNVYNSDATATTPNLYLRSSKTEISSQGNTSGDQNLTYLDKNNTAYAYVKGAVQSNGSAVKIRAIAKDSSDNSVINELQILANTNGRKIVFPQYSNEVELGDSTYKWKSFNGVEPSSLSLPSGNFNDIIDISSYLTYLDGRSANTYIAPANGWISITMSNCSGIQAYINGLWGHQIVRPTIGGVRFLMPILKDKTVNIWIFGGTIDNARFIPCQGNV